MKRTSSMKFWLITVRSGIKGSFLRWTGSDLMAYMRSLDFEQVEVPEWVMNACRCEVWQDYWSAAGRPGFCVLDQFREILVRFDYLSQGSSSCQPCCHLIAFCPFCGASLPHSLRGEWHANLKQMFGEDWKVEDGYPIEYESSEWWIMDGYWQLAAWGEFACLYLWMGF